MIRYNLSPSRLVPGQILTKSQWSAKNQLKTKSGNRIRFSAVLVENHAWKPQRPDGSPTSRRAFQPLRSCLNLGLHSNLAFHNSPSGEKHSPFLILSSRSKNFRVDFRQIRISEVNPFPADRQSADRLPLGSLWIWISNGSSIMELLKCRAFEPKSWDLLENS